MTLQPDAEAVALKRTRDLVRGNSWMRGLRLVAVALTALSLKRLFTDVVCDSRANRLRRQCGNGHSRLDELRLPPEMVPAELLQ